MRATTKRNLLRAHWVFGLAWLLVVVWMFGLAALAAGGAPATAAGAFALLRTLNWVSLGLAAIVIAFGLAYGLWSWWGFGIRHDHWLILQWVLVLAVTATSATIIRFQIAAGTARVLAGHRAVYGGLAFLLMVEAITLLAVMAIAVRKPWKDRAGARRDKAEAA